MSTESQLKKILDRRLEQSGSFWIERQPATMGNYDGVVEVPGSESMVYVRLINGQVVAVYNNRVSNIAHQEVFIGIDKSQPTLWKVIEERIVIDTNEMPLYVTFHHRQHEYPEPDTVFVRRDQFTPLLVLPAGGFNVRFYGDVVYKFGMTAPIRVEDQDIDLSSYAIDAGAKYVRLDIDTDGNLVFTEGDTVGSRNILETTEPLPTPTADGFPVAAFIFHEGQTELRRDDTERTIIDLRMFTSNVVTDAITQLHDGGAEKVTIVDDDEMFGADSEDSFASVKWLWSTIKNTLLGVTNSLYSVLGHSHLGGEGSSAFWTIMPGSPVRVSNTTFTITGDYTSVTVHPFGKGTVIQWAESGAIKCGMISIPPTYSAPNTTFTIIGDTMASIDDDYADSLKYFMINAEVMEFRYAGTIASIQANVAQLHDAKFPMRVIGADINVGTAGTTNSTTVDINKNGSTMFTTKPTLATTIQSSLTPFTADNSVSMALGDDVTLDIDAVQTTPAVDLYVYLYVFPTRYLYMV